MGNVARRPGQDPLGLVRGTHHLRGKRGWFRSDPCKAHKTVPGEMRIKWAPATGLLAARWGINTG